MKLFYPPFVLIQASLIDDEDFLNVIIAYLHDLDHNLALLIEVPEKADFLLSSQLLKIAVKTFFSLLNHDHGRFDFLNNLSSMLI